MISTRVKVIYTGFDAIFDEKIKQAMKQVGCKWYAQGNNFITNERDISFDYVEEVNGN